jgi:hypothetical protein
MPIVRVSQGGEGEGVGAARPAAGGLAGDLGRVTTNLTLADHIGKLIAGQVANQFQNENLADLLKGKNMIMISGSWG